MEEKISQVKQAVLKYKIECGLILAAFVIVCLSVGVFRSHSANDSIGLDAIEISAAEPGIRTADYIYVDISGAVSKPGVYKLKNGTRLNEAVEKSGGYSDEADLDYISRNFNLSRILIDQDKVHFPKKSEVYSGIVQENPHILNYLDGRSVSLAVQKTEEGKINLNSATVDQLDKLPGVGKATAQ